MRRRDLFTAPGELREETLRRVRSKGRANLSQAAIILGVSQPRLRAYCNLGQIQTYQLNKLRYLSLDELERARSIL